MNYLILSLYAWTTLTFHVGHVAEYYYQLDGKHLSLKFVIEKEELLGFKLGNDCDIQKMTALCTTRYLNKHSSIKINGENIRRA